MLDPRVNAMLLCIVTVCGVADCKIDRAGRDYDGRITYMVGNKKCQPWNSKKVFHINNHKFYEEPPSSFVHSSANYCRNKRNPSEPGNEDSFSPTGPWCLVLNTGSDKLYPQPCDLIPLCGQYTRLFIYFYLLSVIYSLHPFIIIKLM